MKNLAAAFGKALKSITGKGKQAEPDREKLNLLLFSNGALADKKAETIQELYGASPETPKTVLYVAYAVGDQDASLKRVQQVYGPLGINFVSAHTSDNPASLLDKVDGVYITGGNTFRLIDKLQKTGLLEGIRDKVLNGMPYMGASAGINVTGLTIMTTNDMPIVQPESFDAMALVPFQINPHYTAGKSYKEEDGKIVPYQGESRADRLHQYHEENSTPIVALPEGSALRVRGTSLELLGRTPAILFRQGKEDAEITSGKDLEFLMQPAQAKPQAPAKPKGPSAP